MRNNTAFSHMLNVYREILAIAPFMSDIADEPDERWYNGTLLITANGHIDISGDLKFSLRFLELEPYDIPVRIQDGDGKLLRSELCTAYAGVLMMKIDSPVFWVDIPENAENLIKVCYET